MTAALTARGLRPQPGTEAVATQNIESAEGALLADDAAPAFWVPADPEGNEVCVCTWQGRD